MKVLKWYTIAESTMAPCLSILIQDGYKCREYKDIKLSATDLDEMPFSG